jgi:hypothetical protein
MRHVACWLVRGLVESSGNATPEVIEFMRDRQRFWSIVARFESRARPPMVVRGHGPA